MAQLHERYDDDDALLECSAALHLNVCYRVVANGKAKGLRQLILTFSRFVNLLCHSEVRVRIESIFISVFNQLDAQNLFYSEFHFMPLHVSSTCAHHQEVKIALHSLWYHHTYRWPSRARDGHL